MKQDYIETINTLQAMINDATPEQWVAIRTAIDAVLQVRAFEEAEQGKWIPVEKQLPELHEEKVTPLPWYPEGLVQDTYLLSDPVLVTGKRKGGLEDDPPVFVGYYEDDGDGRTMWEDVDCEELLDVTAWQPLPKAYKGG